MFEPKKTFALLVSLGLLCGVVPRLNAQQSCVGTAFCRASGPSAECIPHIPANAFACSQQSWDAYCSVLGSNCSPAPECPT